jgi:putative ABC transport system substrate-binding protein
MTVRRRAFITLLGGAAAAWPLVGRAQGSQRLRRVGVAFSTAATDPESEDELQAIRQGLQELGWMVGRNLDISLLKPLAPDRQDPQELVRLAPEVILSRGTAVTESLRQLTRTIPIVFVNVADPLASGFVASFAHPGGNVTGFTSLEYSLAGKWLSLLRDMAPSIQRVMFLYSTVNPNWRGYLRELQAVAPTVGVTVTGTVVETFEEIAHAIEAFAREGGGGMIVQPSAPMTINREMIAALAIRYRLPAMYPYDYYAVSGGLASYGSDSPDQYRRAAVYVDRILKGERAGDLPVQAPTKFELVINLKAAKSIGLEVPYSVLILADRLIE